LSENALEASEKGFHRLVEGIEKLEQLPLSENSTGLDLKQWTQSCYQSKPKE